MSQETQETLDSNLYGDVASVGMPWHARSSAKIDETHYFSGAIPLTVVRQKLAEFDVAEYPMAYSVPAEDSKGRKITKTVTDPTRKVIVRASNGHVHGVFGAQSYTVHQAGDVFTETLGQAVGESPADLHYSGVGGLRKGGRVYVAISTGGLCTTPAGVDYYPFITGATSHDGSLALTFGAGATLSVCDNTLAAALGESKINGTQSKIKHTRFSADKISAVSLKLGLEIVSDSMDAAIKSLTETSVTDEQWSAFVQALTPLDGDSSKHAVTRFERYREELSALYNGDARCEPWRGTAFGALQAANTWQSWVRSVRGDTQHRERMTDDLISGKLASRENETAEILAKVLATV